jgi:hypothetical protein
MAMEILTRQWCAAPSGGFPLQPVRGSSGFLPGVLYLFSLTEALLQKGNHVFSVSGVGSFHKSSASFSMVIFAASESLSK